MAKAALSGQLLSLHNHPPVASEEEETDDREDAEGEAPQSQIQSNKGTTTTHLQVSRRRTAAPPSVLSQNPPVSSSLPSPLIRRRGLKDADETALK